MKKQRIYIDTSVIGGCIDAMFSTESTLLFDMARSGTITFILSDIVLDELDKAPIEVQELLATLPSYAYEVVESSFESEILCARYIAANVVGRASRNDAHHVAIASVERVDMIVSWNFKHIVHLDKIRGFNAVNLQEGYPLLEIRSPREIV
jgi:predicted nucleic acid-binding protein